MFSQIVSAKRSRVGSLLFLDQRHAETKLCAPLYGLNKVCAIAMIHSFPFIKLMIFV
jgi:hypothetical protein